jgi:WD40 repeat protein
MTADPRRVKELFVAALDLPDPQARQAFLERACGDDADLRHRLGVLLKAHDDPASALDRPLAEVGPADAGETSPPAPADGPATASAQGPAEGAGSVVAGRYKLLEPIGEGGMGTVWVAEQTQPVRRKVALKVIKAGMDSRAVLARFEAERQALALMDHPNIAKVLDGGTTQGGRPFFVMEYVKGVPFTRYCDDARLSVAQRLALFLPVCQAVQHAHLKGIIHRDLKPSNILVCLYDGQPVPKVIDFGLAKAVHQPLTEQTLHTAHGILLGTPLYMSPEQAEFNNLDVDTRTDIYALGVILYELLTGTTPLERQRFKEVAWQQILRLIKEEEPERPSARLSRNGSLPSVAAQRQLEPVKLTRLVRGELDWIVMKCLENERSRRYDTATGLAHDLQRYLADEAVEACPPSAGYRLRKFARKHRAALATAGLIALLLTAGIVASTWQAVRATQAEREAARQRDAAVTNEQKAFASEAVAQQKRQEALVAQEQLRRTLYAAEMNLVQAAWEADHLPRIHELLQAQIPPAGQRDLRGFEWHFWDRRSHAEVRSLRLPGPPPETPLYGPLLSRDGARLARLAPRGGDWELQVWDTDSGQKTFAVSLPGKPPRSYMPALSADGGRAAVIGKADAEAGKPAPWQVRVWDVAAGKERPVLPLPTTADTVLITLDANGSRLLTAASSVKLPGTPFATATTNLVVWDLATGKATLSAALGSIRPGLALSPDGTRAAAVVSLDGKGDMKAPHGVKVWDVDAGKEIFFLKTSKGEPFQHLAFSGDGKKLAAAGLLLGMGGIWVWDAATGKELTTIASRRAAGGVRFSPDGKWLASYERTTPAVMLWDAATGQERDALKSSATGVSAVAFRADGKQLCTAASDGTVQTWNAATDERSTAGGFLAFRFARTALSPDGTRIADLPMFGPELDVLKVLDTSGRQVQTLRLPGKGLALSCEELVLSRAGTRVAARWMVPVPGDERFECKVWDVASGQEVFSFAGTGRRSLALSPDGSRLAVPVGVKDEKSRFGVRVDRIKVWDLNGRKEIVTFEPAPRADTHAVAFSPDNKWLATSPLSLSSRDPADAGRGGVVQLVDATTGAGIRALESTAHRFTTFAFSPDGALLAAGGDAQEAEPRAAVVEVWDTATGARRYTLRGHAGGVQAIAFSPDGSRIATSAPSSASNESGVKIWDVATGKELTTLSCPGLVSGLAFHADGYQLIGARSMSMAWDPVQQIWDGSPRR